jgi:hypothetical protein
MFTIRERGEGAFPLGLDFAVVALALALALAASGFSIHILFETLSSSAPSSVVV